MVIQYELTENDIVKFNIQHFMQSPKLRKRRTTSKFVIPVLYSIFAIYFLIDHYYTLSLLAGILFLALAVLLLLFYDKYYFWRLKKNVKSMLSEGSNIGMIGDQTLDNFFSLRVVFRYFFDEVSPLCFCLSFRNLYKTFSGQRLISHKNITHTTTFIFIIMTCKLSRKCLYRLACLFNQLFGRFIHAHNRESRIIRPFIYIQHLLHIDYKTAVLIRRNYPTFFSPRFNFVFFKTRRMVS
ncbi:hypothetical protein ES705_48828 [subsurface metagenome]